mmetsp:Transcript_46697/g.124835  ORF Transcript_46697/g.124835 Transcript_46697/m.124835 type:complete len:246 (-) Transcript_46697:192-929(-)
MFLIKFWTCNFSVAFKMTASFFFVFLALSSLPLSAFLSSFASLSSFLSFLSFLSLSSFLSFLSFLSLSSWILGMNSPMISSMASMPSLSLKSSMSDSFLAFVSSSLGRMQRYQSQFVKFKGVRTPRQLIFVSLCVTFTALQFFALSIVPTAASSSSCSFAALALAAEAAAGSSLSSSLSPPNPPSPSLPSPDSSMAKSVGSSSSSSSSSFTSGFWTGGAPWQTMCCGQAPNKMAPPLKPMASVTV